MSLIIYEIAATGKDILKSCPIDQLIPGEGYVFQIVVAIETPADKKKLGMVIDSIVNNYSGLLPDYRRLKMPFNKQVTIAIITGENRITFFVREVMSEENGYSFSYDVPDKLKRSSFEFDRDGTFLGQSN